MKKRFFKGLSIFLSVVLVAMSLNVYVPAQAAGNETSRTYPGNGYTATFTLFATWDGGSNFQIELKNTGDKKIENWSLLVEYEDEINNIWNAQIDKHEGNKYTIKNAGWNQDVEVGQSICFGMSASSAFTAVPASITLIDNARASKSEGVKVEYSINNNWGNGCTGSISVTNQSDKDIEDWSLEFDSVNSEITFWDGNVLTHDGNHYAVHNAGYNSIIKPGQTVSVGFIVNGNVADLLFTGLKLTEKTEQGANDGSDDTQDIEPLEDIGENYFKEASIEDIVFDEETGLQYVKNQLLISAYLGTPKEAIEEIVEEIGAEIVGYTAITCDYQIEFNRDMTLDDLDEIAEYLEGYPYISAIFLNTASEIAFDGSSNDALYNDDRYCVEDWADANGDGDTNDDEDFAYVKKTSVIGINDDNWLENTPGGDNWGLELLHVPSAWDLITDSHTVKVGVIDGYFENVYIDGKAELVFDDIMRNIKVDNHTPHKYTPHKYGHGDHVAGIIGAKHNNNCGISGVATDVKLYGYTTSEDKTKLDDMNGVTVTSMAGDNVGLNALICNHVKVINMSFGYGDVGMVYAASHGIKIAINKIRYDAQIMTEHLKKLTNAGYDFVITKSAGNFNNISVVTDPHEKYGFRKYSASDDQSKDKLTGVDAEFGYCINAITDKDLKDRIIVVGCVDFNEGTNYNYYPLASCTGLGSRLDVVAPGDHILSTVPTSSDYSAATSPVKGVKLMGGTSQAAPHIAGIAALMYQVKPSASAKKIKEIICSDSNRARQVGGYNVPDASKCVEKALKLADTIAADNNWPTGLIAGSIRDASGNKIDGATFNVQAIRYTTGDYNLDRYSFNFNADVNGDFLYPLPQGMYDVLIYISDCSKKYLPTVIKEVEILPDQTYYMETVKLAEWKSNSKGSVLGIVNDAITGYPLEGVSVKLRKNWDNTTDGYVTNVSGRSIKQAITDFAGTFEISSVALGPYTIEVTKEGYVTAYYNVVATKHDWLLDGYDVTMSLTPELPDDEYRIVLAWGSIPSDLDSHLFYYDKNDLEQFHVYYSMPEAYIDGDLVAKLDLDDTDYYGPETVTITFTEELLKNGYLHYCVHNFSGGEDLLSESNASVRIYQGNKLLKTYSVTQNKKALVWHVFNLTDKGIDLIYKYDDNRGLPES